MPGAFGGAEPLFLLLIALAIEAYVGDRPFRFRWVPHPRRLVARLVGGLEQRLDRPERTPGQRRLRGLIVAAGLALAALAVGWLVALFTRHYPFAWTLEVFVLVMLVAQRSSARRVGAVRAALAEGSLVRARAALAPLAAGRLAPAMVERLEGPGLAVASVAALGRQFAARLVGPVLWYVVLGLPGIFLQQVSLVLGEGPGSRDSAFGRAPAVLAAAISLPPRALAGLVIAAAALFIPGARPAPAALSAVRAPGAPETALAVALGPVPGPAGLVRALAIFAVACLIDAGLVALVALLRLIL